MPLGEAGHGWHLRFLRSSFGVLAGLHDCATGRISLSVAAGSHLKVGRPAPWDYGVTDDTCNLWAKYAKLTMPTGDKVKAKSAIH